MFTLRKTKEPTALDGELERMFIEMNELEIDSEEYKLRLEYLERLTALKPEKGKPLSNDAKLQAGTSLLSILMIVVYEQHHVLTSKALGFINKAK